MTIRSLASARRVADARRTPVERLLGRPAASPGTIAAALGKRDLEAAKEAAAWCGCDLRTFVAESVKERIGRIRLEMLRAKMRRIER